MPSREAASSAALPIAPRPTMASSQEVIWWYSLNRHRVLVKRRGNRGRGDVWIWVCAVWKNGSGIRVRGNTEAPFRPPHRVVQPTAVVAREKCGLSRRRTQALQSSGDIGSRESAASGKRG